MTAPLYQTEDELHAWVAPHLSRPAFARALTEFEHYGFPKVDPVFKGRYAPAVKAWLDDRARVSKTEFKSCGREEEPIHGREKRGPGPDLARQKERAPSAILERRQSLGEGEAPPLPRALDRFTERRHKSGDSQPVRGL
jgi:hypothetical protein